MAKVSFQQTVERIRLLDATEAKTAWEVAFAMGDAVLDQAPMGRDGVNNDSVAILRRLADQSGVDYSVLDDRRKVSAAILPSVRTLGVAWSVYRQIALYAPESERPRLLKLVNTEPPTQLVDGDWRPPPTGRWTVDAILTHIKGKSANPAAGSAWLLDRAFKEATPEAIDTALEKPEVRRAVYASLHRHEQRVAERTERETQSDPVARRIEEQQAMLDLQTWVDQLRQHMNRLRDGILPRLGRAPVSDPLAMRRFLAEALADLDEAIQPVRTFVETGGSDIDAFLNDVLGGQHRA